MPGISTSSAEEWSLSFYSTAHATVGKKQENRGPLSYPHWASRSFGLEPDVRMTGPRFASLNQLEAGEKIGDLERCSIRRVRTVRAVTANAGPQVVADRAWGGFLWIGCTHGVAPLCNSAFRFQHHGKDLTGTHEIGQLSKKRALSMYCVKSSSLLLCQPHR